MRAILRVTLGDPEAFFTAVQAAMEAEHGRYYAHYPYRFPLPAEGVGLRPFPHAGAYSWEDRGERWSVWVTSGRNILAVGLVDGSIEIRAAGRRHGIPWWEYLPQGYAAVGMEGELPDLLRGTTRCVYLESFAEVPPWQIVGRLPAMRSYDDDYPAPWEREEVQDEGDE